MVTSIIVPAGNDDVINNTSATWYVPKSFIDFKLKAILRNVKAERYTIVSEATERIVERKSAVAFRIYAMFQYSLRASSKEKYFAPLSFGNASSSVGV